MYQRPRISDEELAKIKKEIERINTPEWQYKSGFSCGRFASFRGWRDDAKLNDPETTESWKQGYLDAWNKHKERISKLLRGHNEN